MAESLLERLHAAYQVFGGIDETGTPVSVALSDPRVISYASGNGTRRPHPDVIGAGISALLDSTRSSLEDYMFMKVHEEFGSAIYDDFINNGIPAETACNLSAASGTTRLFIAFLWACGKPGDVFLVPRSYYHPLAEWCDISRAGLGLIETTRENSFKLTPCDIDRWYAENPDQARSVRGLFLFNPTQTGAVYTEAELKDIGQIVQDRDLLVLEDAVFSGTEFPGGPQVRHLGAVMPELNSRIVTVRGASKTHNLANIRIGWACSGNIDLLNLMREHIVMSQTTIPYISKSMAAAALRAPSSYREANNAECAYRSHLIADLVDTMNAELAPWCDRPPIEIPHFPQAGHAMMISMPGMLDETLGVDNGIHNSLDLTRFFLNEAKVAMSPGYSLGFDGPELRLTIGSVGAPTTYKRAAGAELATAFGTLADILQRLELGHQDLCLELKEKLSVEIETPAEELFKPGRDLIVEGFTERVLPAMKTYLKKNGNGGHGTLD